MATAHADGEAYEPDASWVPEPLEPETIVRG